MKNEFMQFTQLDKNTTELHIYGEIGKIGLFEKWMGLDEDMTSAMTFKEALEEINTGTLLVRINSGGGSVSEALAIYNQLLDFKGKVITKVDGFAASAASIVFMAGEERIVPSSSLLMIHNAWTSTEGNANDLRKMADDLDKITQPSVNIYVEKTGQPEETIKQLMDDETWITAKEAESYGFSTQTVNDRTEMSYQQSALLSLVKENKALKQNRVENPNQIVIDYDLIAEKVAATLVQKEPKEKNDSSWNGFFKIEQEN